MYFGLLSLFGGCFRPDQFLTGQAARLVIGPDDLYRQDTNSSDTILGGASGLAYAADTLFVADSNRDRRRRRTTTGCSFSATSPPSCPAPTAELQYNRKCPVCVGQATVVLGQPDFVTTTENERHAQQPARSPPPWLPMACIWRWPIPTTTAC